MRACTALINPSLSEGWSTTVEEAKSLGVPMLLSDLRVHREQAGDCAYYFDPEAAGQLASLMARHEDFACTHHAGIERKRPLRPRSNESGNLRLIFLKPWIALLLYFYAMSLSQ